MVPVIEAVTPAGPQWVGPARSGGHGTTCNIENPMPAGVWVTSEGGGGPNDAGM